MKLRKENSRVRAVGLSSFFALLAVLGTAVACPSADMSVSAAESLSGVESALLQIDFYLNNTGAGVSQMSQMLTVDFFLENGDPNYPAIFKLLGIDFVLRNNVAIELTGLDETVSPTTQVQPTPSGQFVSGKTNFSVYTSDAQNGFAVYVGSTDGETAMVNKKDDGTVVSKINTLTAAASSDVNFAGNTWGYKLAATNAESAKIDTSVANYGKYQGLTGDKTMAYKYNGNGDIDFELTFGAKVDMQTQAGDYTRGVEVTAVTPASATVAVSEPYVLANRYIERTFELRPELKDEVDARKAESGKDGTFETLNQILNVMNEEKYSQE